MTDNGLLIAMLDQVHDDVGAVAQETFTATEYASRAQIGLAEERGYEVLVHAPPHEFTAHYSESRPYQGSRFVYDEQKDCCIGPRGQVLTYSRSVERGPNRSPKIRHSL